MVMASTAVLHKLTHDNADDARDEILAAVGDISDVEIFGSQILVGVYVRPPISSGGIITSENEQKEDFWQGKIGLILKIGPNALDENDKPHFNGRLPEVGDWVFMDANSVWQLSLKGRESRKIAYKKTMGTLKMEESRKWDGWPCRLVFAKDIYGRLSSPDLIGSVV